MNYESEVCALLLAAGFGTRLKPLTDTTPKCMVPIGHKPLLEYWLENLVKAGISDITINTHYLNEVVENWVQLSRYRSHTRLLHESTLLGTAGTLKALVPMFSKKHVLLAHADNFSLFDMHDFVAQHFRRPTQTLLTMMTFTTDTPTSCGIVTTDKSGIVTNFFEKVPNPPGNHANGAVYLLSPEALQIIASTPEHYTDFSTQILPSFVNTGAIFTFHNNIYHRDIGTPESYAKAQKDILEPTSSSSHFRHS